MERRNFILLAAGGMAALAIPTWFYTFGPMSKDNLLSTPDLLSTIWDNHTIAKAGSEFLQKDIGENTEAALTDLISKQVSSNPFMLKEELNQLIAEDFKNDRIVMLDGWLLSVTEARQCALFSLTHA
ncbi:MAG: hypothetical protein IPH20_15680 [Bacteroidales bacterium]|nr:hypothetical protein [Bacteroidales bacterium]